MKFTIGEITADSGARSGWILAALSDWLSLPQSKADETERPQAHGLFDPGTDWRTGAGFTATLSYRGETPGEVEQAVRELKAIASTDDLVRCVVETDLGTTWREVSIRKIDIPGLTFMGFMKGIALDLLAPDPLAYGVESSVSTGLPAPGGGVVFPVGFPVGFGAAGVDGRARFTNDGTAPAPVRFRVSGGLPDGFSLRCVETGDALTFRRPVASDDYVLLDSSDGSALLNGVSPVSGYLTDDDWWQVGPGETCTVQFTSLGGVQGLPLLVLSGSPAYF